MSDIPASEIIASADIEPFEAEEMEGAAVVDAFLVFRYQHPDWPAPRTAFIGSESLIDEVRIGILTMTLDRIRAVARSRWVEDDE